MALFFPRTSGRPAPSRHSIFFFLGFLIYCCLYSSISNPAAHGHDITIPEDFSIFFRMWRLVVFLTLTLVLRRYFYRWSRSALILGAIISLLSSAFLLQETRGILLLPSGFFGLLFLQFLESSGEALSSNALLTLLRTQNRADWDYFEGTAWLRAGQNLGIGLVVIAPVHNWVGEEQPRVILLFRLIFTLVSFAYIRTLEVASEWKRGGEKPELYTLGINTFLGACSYALFYLLVFGPVGIYECYDERETLSFNVIMALIAVLILLCWGYHRRTEIAKKSVISLQGVAVTGVVLLGFGWAWTLLIDYTAMLFWMGGLFGLVSTANYVLSELSVGLHGHQEGQQVQSLVTFSGCARLGSIAALVIVMISPSLDVSLAKALMAGIVLVGIFSTAFSFHLKRLVEGKQP